MASRKMLISKMYVMFSRQYLLYNIRSQQLKHDYIFLYFSLGTGSTWLRLRKDHGLILKKLTEQTYFLGDSYLSVEELFTSG